MKNPITWALPALMLAATSSEPIAAQNPAPAPASKQTWKRPSDAELKKKLTPLQFAVTRKADTEMAFHNEYWDNHARADLHR